MKEFVQNLLAYFAKKILAKYKPQIIGITGSVGKSSTKEAVFLVVRQKFFAGKSEKSFNGEIGLPLSIIGIKFDPQKNPLSWLRVFLKAISLLIVTKRYPEILVLEYGVDHVGDMDKLLTIAKPDLGIITAIGVSHYEYFKNAEAIATEKGKLAAILDESSVLIVNADNPKAFEQKNKTKAKILTYALSNQADVGASLRSVSLKNPFSAELTIKTPTRSMDVAINAIGDPHYFAVTAAAAVGEALHIETDLIIKGLKEYKPAPGRLNIIPGIKHSTIIDDTYNASPDSMKQAINLFSKLEAPLKIAVLGTMRELGEITESTHKEIGQLIASVHPHYLITVAAGGKLISEAALEAGLPENIIKHFQTSEEAKQTVRELIQPGALVLAKGSQNTVRLEKIVKEIMAEPMRANELLVRQYGDWLNS